MNKKHLLLIVTCAMLLAGAHLGSAAVQEPVIRATRVFFRIYLQAESNTGTETQETFAFENISGRSANFLTGYEFAAGTMLYLVYNQQRVFDPRGINHILVAKFTYSLRF